MLHLGKQIRFSLRSLATHRYFALVWLLTVALALGGTSIVFTLVHVVLLKPLPYPEADRLIMLWANQAKSIVPGSRLNTIPDLLDIRRASRSIDQLAMYNVATLPVELSPEAAQRLPVIATTPELFQLLTPKPVLGRVLTSEDGRPSSTAVVLLGYDAWQKDFGGDPSILGKTIIVRQRPLTIVGVMPRHFQTVGSTPDALWTILPTQGGTRVVGAYYAIGRLRAGTTLSSANEELRNVSVHIAEDNPSTNRDRVAFATALKDEVLGGTKQALWMFAAAVALVLLIAVVNLMSLQLARAAARHRETNIKVALGASIPQLVAGMITEATILAVIGGILAAVGTVIGIHVLLQFLPAGFPRIGEIAISWQVFVFGFSAAITVGLIAGLAPALSVVRLDLGRGGQLLINRSASGGQRRAERALIVCETATAFALLLGSTTLGLTFFELVTSDSGFKEENLWTAKVTVSAQNNLNRAFWTDSLERIRKLPGVQAAALVNAGPPLAGPESMLAGIFPEGKGGDPQDGLTISHRSVTSRYFAALGVPIKRGRSISESDTSGAVQIAVVNERLAQVMWPGQDALGKTIRSGNFSVTVVGTVPNFRHRSLEGEIVPQLYTSLAQQAWNGTLGTFVVRTESSRPEFASDFRAAIGHDAPKALVDIFTMAQLRWQLVAAERLRTALGFVFTGVAAFLAAVGIFGIVSHSVSQRRNELAVRIALGASGADVTTMIIRHAFLPSAIGLTIGGILAMTLQKPLAVFLPQPVPLGITAFLIAALLLAAVVLGAAVVPAIRAARTDPLEALRVE
jgi:putative ABC transport system permease protein